MRTIVCWLLISLFLNPTNTWSQRPAPDRNKFKDKHKLRKKPKKEKPSREQVRNGRFNFKSSRLKDNPNGRLDITAGLKNPTSLQFGP
ncbi:hypothetical protein, partial [Larkinella arboricola]